VLSGRNAIYFFAESKLEGGYIGLGKDCMSHSSDAAKSDLRGWLGQRVVCIPM
jgi:hypothetical protein